MVQGILVNDLDSAADERLCGGVVMGHNMLPGFCVAATALLDLAPLVLQLLQLLPVVSIACIILIWIDMAAFTITIQPIIVVVDMCCCSNCQYAGDRFHLDSVRGYDKRIRGVRTSPYNTPGCKQQPFSMKWGTVQEGTLSVAMLTGYEPCERSNNAGRNLLDEEE